MKFAPKFRRTSQPGAEQGYILLTLMLLATLIVLSLTVAIPDLIQQMKRDREMELIHRGVQYSRAIQHFYKKTGRYPVRLEELDSFNNVRFLRKHYKDPITGQDFKLLHFGEVQIGFAAGIAGGVAPGANQMGGINSPPGQPSGFGQQSAFGQPSAFGQQQQSAFGQPSAFGQQQQSAFGQQSASASPAGSNPQGPPGMQPQAAEDATDSATQVNPQPGGMSGNSAASANPNTSVSQNGMGGNGPVFGGGPVVGVASTSKNKSIREFNKKNHYKDWQFIYDPSSDRGGLLNTPAQPSLMPGPAGPAQGQGVPPNGIPPGGNMPGQPSGSFGSQGMQIPNQPPDQMQQQQ